jgi:hypothetical protein
MDAAEYGAKLKITAGFTPVANTLNLSVSAFLDPRTKQESETLSVRPARYAIYSAGLLGSEEPLARYC